MENNQQQFLNSETYIGVIQELSSTISNLHIELALAKTQYKEVLEYAQKLQKQLSEITESAESPEFMNAEIVGADINE